MSSAFTIFPMSQEMLLESGYVYEGSISISVPSDAEGDFHYEASVTPYSVLDSDYTADLTSVTNWSQIVNWITIDEPTGTLKPNESKTLTFKVNVPMDAPAGGQYATIAIRSKAPENANEGVRIGDSFEMASVVFASIKGNTLREGEVVENNIPAFVTNNNSANVSALITNNGNVHETALIAISVKNSLSGEVIFPQGKNETFGEIIMPGTSRYISRNISNLPGIGIFEVTQNITYLGETSYNTSTMFLCPTWFIILFILTIGAVIGTLAGLIVRRKNKAKCL